MIDDPNHPPPNDVRPTEIPVAFHKTEKVLTALLENGIPGDSDDRPHGMHGPGQPPRR